MPAHPPAPRPPRITSADLDAILRFLPVFEAAGFVFGEEVAAPGRWGWSRMAPEVEAFVQALHAHGWVRPFPWHDFQDEAMRYLEDPSRLDGIDVETARKLLTLHVRKERFCDGHLIEMFRAGHVQAILRRLRAIREAPRRGRPR